MKLSKQTLKIMIIFTGFILLISMQSCNKNKIYSNSVTLENYTWYTAEPIIFEIPISKDQVNIPTSLFLNIRYIQGFPYKYLYLKISIADPKGVLVNRDVKIPIQTDNSEYIGDGAGDYWDLDFKVDEYFTFEDEGKYTIHIVSQMDEDPVNFMNEIGISIEKKE